MHHQPLQISYLPYCHSNRSSLLVFQIILLRTKAIKAVYGSIYILAEIFFAKSYFFSEIFLDFLLV